VSKNIILVDIQNPFTAEKPDKFPTITHIILPTMPHYPAKVRSSLAYLEENADENVTYFNF